ncbi:hypothetical protein TNCV_3017051 [Trichonephila clavipes]|nr:hypothetical protein TNCV_3017051 [Trichonephila clavipes]
MQEESDVVDDETGEDEDNNNESRKCLSNADAFSALETAMEWYEQQTECCPDQLLMLKKKKRESETLQRKIEGQQWYSKNK